MPVNVNGIVYQKFFYRKETQFEKTVGELASFIFGPSTIYIDKKKRIKGGDITSIPDAYLIDMTEVDDPKLYVIENEIVAHDPFNHIGIQLLRFATSFEESRLIIKNHLMHEITERSGQIELLEKSCASSSHRNIDNYLDKAVYGEFRALVIIDEARSQLHNVIKRINANISILEISSYKSTSGEILHLYDTLYDEGDDHLTDPNQDFSSDPTAITKRRQRRAKCDTVVVPAREEGFKNVFLGENRWYAIRIGAAMKSKIKHIAAYQVSPVSSITHIASVDAISLYEDTGKYQLTFKNPAEPITPLKVIDPNKSPQGPVYVEFEKLLKAKTFDELLEY